jgi:hypothetical protein
MWDHFVGKYNIIICIRGGGEGVGDGLGEGIIT